MTAELHHIAVAVSDLDASIAFYVSAFDGEVVLRDDDLAELISRAVGQPGLTAALAHVRLPGTPILLELVAFPGAPQRTETDWGARTVAPGMAHISFRVHDLAASREQARAAGAEQLGELTTFPRANAVYLREPGGSTIELTELRPV